LGFVSDFEFRISDSSYLPEIPAPLPLRGAFVFLQYSGVRFAHPRLRSQRASGHPDLSEKIRLPYS
jgi:hypothetical protein